MRVGKDVGKARRDVEVISVEYEEWERRYKCTYRRGNSQGYIVVTVRRRPTLGWEISSIDCNGSVLKGLTERDGITLYVLPALIELLGKIYSELGGGRHD